MHGRAYDRLHGAIYKGTRVLHQCDLLPCDVHQGYRTRARAYFARCWQRGADGFKRLAAPLRGHEPWAYFGWEAPAVCGGACGGLEYPQGLLGQFGFKVRLRRTRALLEDEPLCFYYKAGIEARCGALGTTRLVRPRLWLPADGLQVVRWVSSDERFLNVHVKWVRSE